MKKASDVRRLLEGRGLTVLVAVAVLIGAVGAVAGAIVVTRSSDEGNVGRFAALTFGAQGGRAALAALGTEAELEDEEEEEELETELSSPPDLPAALIRTTYRTPNGWLLRPAGQQIDVARAPTGVAVSPDDGTVAVISSGIFNEDLTVVDAETLLPTPYPIADGYMGVAFNATGYVWASTGSRNRVYQFRLESGLPIPERAGTPLIPQGRVNNGIPVTGYPGNMVLHAGKLYVAGNLSVPANVAGSCPTGSAICSVINVIDVSDPSAANPAVTKIPVGRDAFGLALNAAANKLYVTNWADETDAARTTGNAATATGTVSVVDLGSPPPAEVAHVAVGHHPTGIALSPDGTALFVANSADDTLSKIVVNGDGSLGAVSTVDVKTTPDAPRGATPIALAFATAGSNTYLLVGMAGQNAVQVRNSDGSPLLQSFVVNAQTLNVPTYIPTGWYPSAFASAPHPSGTGTRLYVTNLKGIGAGPGYNAQAEPFSGVRTQGTLSVIDLDPVHFTEWTRTVVENNNWATLFSTQNDAAKDPCLDPGDGITKSRLLCDEWGKRLLDPAPPSPYHVVYVVKENKTFDQFFGDINTLVLDADADPTYLLYGLPVTTNQHLLAKEFTIGDRFWADSEASTTGHQWTSAGYTTEYVEITWNPEYSQGFRGSRGSGQYEGQYAANSNLALSPIQKSTAVDAQEGELFDPDERLVDVFANTLKNPRGATFRIYSGDVKGGSPAAAERVPLGLWGLGGSTPHGGGDLEFPDTDRAELFINGSAVSDAWTMFGGGPPASYGKEIAFCGAPDDPNVPNAPGWFNDRPGCSPDEYQRFALEAWASDTDCQNPATVDMIACQSAMPNFIYMVMPVDHTLGFNPLAPTPASMVADNDYAFGGLVEALSKSPFWKNTLILTTEDDTQLAGDHVDSHRTFLLAAGGLARRHGQLGKASHQPGSLPSIIKTVEVLFGIEPFSIYDRAAVPLHDFIVDCVPGALTCGSQDDRNSVVYEAVRPPTPFLHNPPEGDLATLSMMLDWRLDMTDPDLLTALFYYGERGWPLPERYKRLLEEARE